MHWEEWAKILGGVFGGGAVVAIINQLFTYKNNRAGALEKTNEELLTFWTEADAERRKEVQSEMNGMRLSFEAELKSQRSTHAEEIKSLRDSFAGERVSQDMIIQSLSNEINRMIEARGSDNLVWQEKYNNVLLTMEQNKSADLKERNLYLEGMLDRFEGFCREIVMEVKGVGKNVDAATKAQVEASNILARSIDTNGKPGDSPPHTDQPGTRP